MLHFTPTSSSWLNLVERWFRELTEKRVRRGSFGSVPELIHAIEEYLTTSNANPKPLVLIILQGLSPFLNPSPTDRQMFYCILEPNSIPLLTFETL